MSNPSVDISDLLGHDDIDHTSCNETKEMPSSPTAPSSASSPPSPFHQSSASGSSPPSPSHRSSSLSLLSPPSPSRLSRSVPKSPSHQTPSSTLSPPSPSYQSSSPSQQSPSVPKSPPSISNESDDRLSKSGNMKSIRGVSDHLLQPTKANLSDQRKLHELKQAAEMESKEGSSPLKNPKYDHIQSKLLQPTASYAGSIATKYNERDNHSISHHSDHDAIKKVPKSIEVSATLLQPTAAMKNGVYKKKDDIDDMMHDKVEIIITPARRLSLQSGPRDVSSRLSNPTKAMESCRWKSKEEIESEAEMIMLAEKASRSNEKKIVAPSSHILAPTAAMEHRKYHKPASANDNDPREVGWKNTATSYMFGSLSPATNDEEYHMPTDVKKVKETSSHLLAPTVAMENARWRSSSIEANSPGIKPAPLTRAIRDDDHLLSKTAAMINASYKKKHDDDMISSDPREKGWNQHFKSSSSSSGAHHHNDASSIPPSRDEYASVASSCQASTTSYKIKETSSRLLKPTKSNEYAKWDPVIHHHHHDEVGIINRRVSTSDIPDHHHDGEMIPDVKKSSPVKEVSASLLRSTTNMEHSRYIKPSSDDHHNINSKDYQHHRASLGEFKKEVMERLIRPTTAATHGRYIKPEDRDEYDAHKPHDDANDDKEKVKVSVVSDRLLKLTVSNKHSKYMKPEDTSSSSSSSAVVHQHDDDHPHDETSSLSPAQPVKVREVSARLLRPTANFQASKWKEPSSSPEHVDLAMKRSPIIIRNGSMTSSTRASRTSSAVASRVASRITSRITSRATSPHSNNNPHHKVEEDKKVIPVVTRGSRLASRMQSDTSPVAATVEHDIIISSPSSSDVRIDADVMISTHSNVDDVVDDDVIVDNDGINLQDDIKNESTPYE